MTGVDVRAAVSGSDADVETVTRCAYAGVHASIGIKEE